jgi:ABC-2 type transport system ATP-binding protein
MLQTIQRTRSDNGTAALHPLNLRMEPGGIFCLPGANGAGKTTTMNLFFNCIR